MAKLTYVLRRKPELTREQFQKYWLENHGPLVRSHAATLGIRRYVQVHTPLELPQRAPDAIRGEMLEPFDGVAELWFDADLATGTPEERREAGRQLAEDEAKFIDFAGSSSWTAEEHVIVDG